MKEQTDEIEKKYYTIGEVAKMFDVAPSLIRFWETQFDAIRPRKTKNGVRQYTRKDIEQVKVIYHLVKQKGYTLQGAKEALNEKPDAKAQIAATLEMLEELKTFLTDLRQKFS